MTEVAAVPPPPPSPAAVPPWQPLDATARLLGNLGLLPFVLGTLLIWVVNVEAHPYATLALSSYAAVVVSFLGGIYWGLGFRLSAAPAGVYLWGVVPSLVAWAAVMMPASSGLVIHGLMLVVCYLVDRRLYPAHGLARWLTLRFRLSSVAALCCFLGAAGT